MQFYHIFYSIKMVYTHEIINKITKYYFITGTIYVFLELNYSQIREFQCFWSINNSMLKYYCYGKFCKKIIRLISE